MKYDGLQVVKITMQGELQYNQVMLLSYKIEYPQFRSEKFTQAVNRINLFYQEKAMEFERYCHQELFKMAIEQYWDSIKNGFPVRVFEAVMAYEITYNQNCAVSLYFDRYEYTGGAHGSTTRSSETWDLHTSQRIPLSRLFIPSVRYKEYVIWYVKRQIAEQIASGNNIYFEDYRKNVAKTFNEKQFYLSKAGVVIYFQQYDIAPYASGIPEFTIPYSEKVIVEPRCIR